MPENSLTPEKDFAGRQCLGKRSEQEDAYAFSEIPGAAEAPIGLLIVVADGMGGHSAGHEASDLAVRAFVTAFHRKSARLAARLSGALQAANEAISEAIKASPGALEGMGTTLLAVAATPGGLLWISVGDSPLYLHRGGRLQRINEDHSFRPILREMVEKGEITEEQATHSSLRNRLRSAITGEEIAIINASVKPLPLIEGDLILAASDGLQTLNDEAIAKAIEEARDTDAAETATRVLQAVLGAARPKQDNATVAIFKPSAAWLFQPPPGEETDDSEETQRLPPREKQLPLGEKQLPSGERQLPSGEKRLASGEKLATANGDPPAP